MAKSSPKGLKTLWEKEKLLVTSNFSFSDSVFNRLVLQTFKNQGLFGKGLMTKGKKPSENNLGLVEKFCLPAFSLYTTIFSHLLIELHHMSHFEIVVCKCFQYGKSGFNALPTAKF